MLKLILIDFQRLYWVGLIIANQLYIVTYLNLGTIF